MDNQNNNTNNTVNELSTSMPTQTTPVEGPPSPSQIVSNNVSTGTNSYASNQVQYQSQTTSVQPQTMTNSNNNVQSNSSLLNSDDLIKAFIGPNYDKILRRPFNFAAFFFTAFYYFYRKMNLYAIIILILQGVVSYFFSSTPYAVLVINLLCGLLTNKLYARYAVRKINKTLMNNTDKSVVEVKGMCYVIGGRSIARIFFVLFLLSPFLLIVVILILISGSLTAFQQFIKNIDFSNIKLPEIKLPDIEFGEKFDGNIITDKDNNILYYFNIITPSNFNPTSNHNEYLLSYEYKSNKKKLSTCSYQLGGVSGYYSPKTLINQMHEYYKDKNPSEVKTEMINRISWNNFHLKNDEGTDIYYYTCGRGNKVFLYVYKDEKNSSDICHTNLDSILHAITFK